MKAKTFKITDHVLVCKDSVSKNVIIDSFIYILVLSAGTTIVLIAEATSNFAVFWLG
jgi:hypothetical protein